MFQEKPDGCPSKKQSFGGSDQNRRGLKHTKKRFGESGRWLFRWNILLQRCST
jgi:hypothetical protein